MLGVNFLTKEISLKKAAITLCSYKYADSAQNGKNNEMDNETLLRLGPNLEKNEKHLPI